MLLLYYKVKRLEQKRREMKLISSSSSILLGSRSSLNLVFYCLVVLLIARDHIVLSKSLFRSSGFLEASDDAADLSSDDLVDFSDRQKSETAQISSTEQQKSDKVT